MYAEKDIGIFSFLSSTPGIGGKLRKKVEDFYVEEIPLELEKKENGRNLCIKVKLFNWETNRFVKILSKNLGISKHRIKFAGNKDKRGITIQYFCILNYREKIKLELKDVEILEEFRSDKEINIGDLYGNKFNILVRDAKCDDRVNKIEEELNGFFPNFFGVQRFGASRPITHIVGKFIIEGKYDEAVRYYIGFPSSFDEDEGRKIFFENMDARETIKNIGKNASYERAMLNHLIKNEGDYVGALKQLPKNLLLLFVHGYQSYIFNKILSKRLEIGIDVQVGDIVMKVDKFGLPMKEFVKVTDFNIAKIKKLIEARRAYVSTILFGYNSHFSGGVQGEIEREVINEEGINKKMFHIREIPELSSKGRRRNIVAPIIDYTRNECNFKFTLHRGSYATSLMREFMKQNSLEFY